jgi:thiamine-monophosphate kinase
VSYHLSMDEIGLVTWIVAQSGRPSGPNVKVGPGDDCAVLGGTGDDDILFTIDEVVEGTHFRLSAGGRGPKATGRDVGYKALAVSVSDLAAMGADPIAAVASAAIRADGAGRFGKAIYAGLTSAAGATGCPLVGGNVAETSGPQSVSVAAIGRAPKGAAFLRSGARPGDVLFVTGALGGSILGRHLRPEPRLAEAALLRRLGGVSAMMDVSDGLALDLTRLTKASSVGAVVDADCVPVSRAARALALRTGRRALEHALTDGEDYELLFTVGPRAADRLLEKWRGTVPITRIGSIEEKKAGVRLKQNGRLVPLGRGGFKHL